MTKNIIIAVLVGIIIGQTCKADTTINNGAITRKDLFVAAALCGQLANSTYSLGGHHQDNCIADAKNCADKLMQDLPAAQ